jgi:hypothetical protein
MQIQLKQREIEEALKGYISQQGINLAGKTVEIEFTSGRKDNGLSADLTIEDSKVATTPEATEATEPAAKAASLFNK